MLHPFISSRATRAFPARSAGISVAVHVVLVTATVVMTSRARTNVHVGYGDVPEPVIRYTLVFPRPPVEVHHTTPSRGSGGRAGAAARAARRPSPLARLATLSSALRRLELPLALPPLVPAAPTGADFAAMAVAGIDLGGAGGSYGLAAAFDDVYARAEANGAYLASNVDRMTWPRRGNPVPEYPRELLRAGVEAAYDVTYVVDSTGRVDRATIAVPGNAHRLFAAAIRHALARSRYFPAMVAGRPVSQVVRQQFRFELARQVAANR